VYGSSFFEKHCDYHYNEIHQGFQEDIPSAIGGKAWNTEGEYHGYRGQICIMTAPTSSPWWANFSYGDMTQAPLSENQPGYCQSGGLDTGVARYPNDGSATKCSATRRFAIFIRAVDCSSQLDSACAKLNRHACFSTENTCGRCLPGFVSEASESATAGVAADRGAWDSNSACWADAPFSPEPAPEPEPEPEPEAAASADLSTLECETADQCRVRELEAEIARLREENGGLHRQLADV
jgi:hypothetical protein